MSTATSSPSHSIRFNFHDQDWTVLELDDFGFAVEGQLLTQTSPDTYQGLLHFRDEQVPVEFQTRRFKDGQTACRFINLEIRDKERLQAIRKRVELIATGNEELASRSYDELAEGFDGSQSTENAETENESTAPDKRTFVKSIALLLMLLLIAGLALAAVGFMKSRGTLSVANSALVGNYLPINARIEGRVEQVFVQEGDFVKEGETIIRLSNRELETELATFQLELDNAKAKVTALKKQQQSFSAKLDVASQKFAMDLEIAKAELENALSQKKVADSSLAKITPYLETGAVTQLELDEAKNNAFAAQSEVVAKQKLINQIEFSQKATSNNILVMGDRLDDDMGKLVAEIDIASAEVKRLDQLTQLARSQIKQLEIKAPRDGRVFVTYRQAGEFLKVADEVAALSVPGKSWAAGQVTAYQANRVLPGQPVNVTIKSLNLNLTGIVSAVGHRAMYAKGSYTADFRGTTATDVPVRVLIDELPDEIPSGIRLDMVISTGYGIGWLDNTLGYELQPFGRERLNKDELAEKLNSDKSIVSQSP
jgi:multidrug resistance efflux pump